MLVAASSTNGGRGHPPTSHRANLTAAIASTSSAWLLEPVAGRVPAAVVVGATVVVGASVGGGATVIVRAIVVVVVGCATVTNVVAFDDELA